jgi:opacity protein-like surface antigen
MRSASLSITLLALVVCAAALPAVAANSDSTTVAYDDLDLAPALTDTTTALSDDGLIYLVPSLEGAGYRVSDDRARYKNRISFSPAIGQLGSQNLFAIRLGFSPNTWLGYEISLGHNPASSVHAVLHSFNVILRYPISWRAQPYVSLGYGMMTVHPGEALNADPVTKNTLTAGGGLEFYIRNDVALRGEIRSATVLGQQLGIDGTIAYQYREYTIGFAFYRSLGG